jgi:hypothetical protein
MQNRTQNKDIFGDITNYGLALRALESKYHTRVSCPFPSGNFQTSFLAALVKFKAFYYRKENY